jgi:hypothetical protein
MRLEGSAGQHLELHLAAYQFMGTPQEGDGFDWDANWLVIEGEAKDGSRSWAFRDPCLLTFEARELAAWLAAVAGGQTGIEAIDFTEPNLEFRRMSLPGEQPVVRVTFRLESRSPWAPDPYEDDQWDACWLEFETSAANLRVAAEELLSELERFPER